MPTGPDPVRRPAFGAGSDEPYAHLLRGTASGLRLHDASRGTGRRSAARTLNSARYLADADDADLSVLRRAPGPVLDAGCGPGRIVRAAAAMGIEAMGVDVSAAAVRLARRRGAHVLLGSVFDELPRTGLWGSVVLLDGNIGIGGDPLALLRRCAQLVAPGGGRVLVEAHADTAADRSFTGVVEDDLGRRSRSFPWAELGTAGLQRYAEEAGLLRGEEWTRSSRTFAEYRRP